MEMNYDPTSHENSRPDKETIPNEPDRFLGDRNINNLASIANEDLNETKPLLDK